MRKIIRYISFLLSALMLISGSTFLAGAAVKKSVKVKTISCNSVSCKNLQDILKKMGCDKNCDITKVLKTQKGYCPSGNCSTDKAEKQTSKPPQQAARKPSAQADSTPVSTEFKTSYEDKVISLVNAERAKNGLSSLKKDSGAVKVARVRAKEIVKSFSHTRPDGSSCFTAASEQGVSYRTAGENIAFGYPSPEKVVTGWMNSEGHRKNILSKSFTKIGVGCYESAGVLYWSQFFIG